MSTHVLGRVGGIAVAALSVWAVACGGDDGQQAEVPAEPEPVEEPPPKVGPPAPKNLPPVCAEATGVFTAPKQPSNVLLLVDRSGSMQIKVASGETRWAATKKGLFELLANLPATTETGLMLFPQGNNPFPACSIDPATNRVKCLPRNGTPERERPPRAPRCNPATYAMQVGTAPLSAEQGAAIQTVVNDQDDDFYYATPMAAALEGAITAQMGTTRPGARSVILLTDGNPTECVADGQDDPIGPVVNAAARGAAASPQVRTFVMGVVGTDGASPQKLSPVARAGATARAAGCEADNSCFYAVNGATFQADIKRAFEEISLQTFDCTFKMPPVAENNDPDDVTVTVSGATISSRTISRDATHTNGWDYLPGNTEMRFYGQACTDMKKDGSLRVDVVMGCIPYKDPVTK